MTIYKEQMFYVHINHYYDHCALKAALYMVYKYMYNSIPRLLHTANEVNTYGPALSCKHLI